MVPLPHRVPSSVYEQAVRLESTTLSMFSLLVMCEGPPWCAAALAEGGGIEVWGAFLAAGNLGVLARVNHPNGSRRYVVWAPGDTPADSRFVEVVSLAVAGVKVVADPNGPESVVNGTMRGRRNWGEMLPAASAPEPATTPTGSSAPLASPAARG